MSGPTRPCVCQCHIEQQITFGASFSECKSTKVKNYTNKRRFDWVVQQYSNFPNKVLFCGWQLQSERIFSF